MTSQRHRFFRFLFIPLLILAVLLRTGAVPTACRFTYQIFHAKQHPVESDTGQQ